MQKTNLVGEIKVNPLNEIKKIREGLVYSPSAIIYELIQNSQRANSSKIFITLEKGYYSQTDNGMGAKNFQDLFEKSCSGWTHLSEEKTPFGEGFFSVFAMADSILVESQDWSVAINVEEMLKSRDLSFEVETVPYRNGFKVELWGSKIEAYYSQLVSDTMRVGALVEPEVTLNGLKIRKKSIFELENSRFDYSLKVDNKYFCGVIAPSDNWYGMDFYYENRPVTDMWFDGLAGKLQLKDGGVKLKAPDRQDIVRDEAYNKLRDTLMKEATKLYRKVVSEATDEEIDKLADKIDTYLEVKEYINFLTFKNDIEIKTSTIEETTLETEVKKQGFIIPQRQAKDNTAVCSLDTEPKKSYGKRRGNVEEIKKDKKKIMYVNSKDVESYEELIQEMKYYGITVMVAKNVLYERAYESLGIINIKEAQKSITREYKEKNIYASTKKQERLLYFLLPIIEKHFNVPGVFRLADITQKVTTQILNYKSIEEVPVYATSGEFIYINKKELDLSVYRMDNFTGKFNKFDAVLLMSLQGTIAHELAHYIYHTSDNTVDHFQKQEMLNKEIGKLFYNPEILKTNMTPDGWENNIK